MHVAFIGIGSNLGDRQGNILAALQRLRVKAGIERVSAFFESEPAEGAEGPAFLNVAATLAFPGERSAFERLLRDIEIAVGRAHRHRLAARPIDIDILRFDDDWHPNLAQRAYDLVPLAQVAGEACEPMSGRTVTELLGALGDHGVRKRERSLRFTTDRQDERPAVRLSLNRVGVGGVKRIVRLEIDGRERVYTAELSMVADLAPDRSGVHMSRFSEILEEATLDVLARTDAPARIERLVEAIARQIVQSQRAIRAEVRLRADFGLERWTPVSAKRGEEIYTLIGIAQADSNGVRRVVGVEAEGMTACPCAQAMMREHSVHELREAGFSNDDAQRALDALPVATHNQRGRGSILVGVGDTHADLLRAEDLVEIVENAMSSETYDLLKRPDEFFVVNKAHHNPKFVEDVVREILCGALDCYADLPDQTFVFASQVNYESIHKHDAFAEGFGTFGECRQELRSGEYVTPKTDLATWLAAGR